MYMCRLAEWLGYSRVLLPLSDDIFEEAVAQTQAKLLALRPPPAAEKAAEAPCDDDEVEEKEDRLSAEDES